MARSRAAFAPPGSKLRRPITAHVAPEIHTALVTARSVGPLKG